MIKILRLTVFFIVGLFISSTCYAQFPYVESFRNATASGIVFGGAPSAFLTASGSSASGGTPIDPIGSGYLRLTNAEQNQKGYAYSTSDFPSSNGLKVEFEYATYGGSRADGISFFLFDATADPFKIGGFGGSLGYAQINTTNPISEGVSKGYLAIGLDEYGNFSNNNEGRQGGIGFIPGSITLRGKGDGASMTPDNYRFLTTVHPDELGVSLIGDGSKRISDPTNLAYRKVAIELIPNPAGGYNINVYLTKGGSPQERIKIIDNYYYQDAAPANLRYGFASSTGDDTNFHEIRNVSIDLYYSTPIAGNDIQNVCLGNIASFDITSNDKANAGGATLNKSTIDLDPATAGVQKTLTLTGKGLFSVNNSGILQFVPESGFLGTANLSYNLRDSEGTLSNTATVTLNYSTPPSSANAGVDQTISISNTTSATLSAADPSPNQGVWTQISGPNNAAFTSPNLYNTTVTNLTSGSYVFRWTITSPGGCSVFDEVNITINRPPVAVNDASTTPLNTPVIIPIINNDTDDNGNASINKGSISVKSSTANGTLSIDNSTGLVTYTPNASFTGTDTFTYTVKDANNAESNVATVTIIVNRSLVGLNDVATTNVNTPVIVHVLDNDPKKVGATVLKTSDPSHGTIIINADGTITYTPILGYSGKDTFTYKLTNSSGDESDPITVNLNVKPTGVTDVANSITNVSVVIPVKDNDPGKAGTTLVINTQPINGIITIDLLGNINYVPTNGFSGKDSFTYILKTADGIDSDPITANVNIKPLGSPDNIITTPNVAVPLPVKQNDLSTAGTTVVLTSSTSNGSVVVNPDATVGYIPNNGFSGKDSFTYILRTADGLNSDLIPVTITVKPIGSADNVNTPPNTPITISVKENDLSKDGTTVVTGTTPLHGTAAINANGTVTYVPNGQYSGKDIFTYILRTADGVDSEPITVQITIKPIGSPDNVSTAINTPVTLLIKDNDFSKTGTTAIVYTSPSNGTLSTNGVGNPVYTPNPGFFGKDTFTYVLRTADGIDSDPITVTVNIKPIGTADDTTTPPNTTVNIPVKDNDASKTGTTVTLGISPNNGSVTVNPDGTVSYTPLNGFSGKDTFTYLLNSADEVLSDPITVTVLVRPVGSNDNVTTTPDTPVSFSVKDNDLSKTGTTVALISNPLHGSLVIDASGNAVYTPVQAYSGPDSFIYVLRTPDGLDSAPITVNLTVKTPVIIPAPNLTIETSVNGPVTINIPIPPGGTVTITDPPKNGKITFDPITGKPIYTPNPGYDGPDDFTYIVKDADGNTSLPGKVTISVKIAAKIGLSKVLTANSPTKNIDGSYNVSYTFNVRNYGDVGIDKISLVDDLTNTFEGNAIKVNRITATGTLIANANYNGTTTTEMLAAGSILDKQSKATVTLEINVNPDKKEGLFLNSAFVKGFSVSNGSETSDLSNNSINPDPKGDGDVSPSEFTSVTLIKETIRIPGGFSPNNDGINDLFVIENALGRQLNLEVYNRWGNRIYKAKSYQNNWNGKTTEGIHVGDDVPSGTYYYILTIDNQDKRVGYITINR